MGLRRGWRAGHAVALIAGMLLAGAILNDAGPWDRDATALTVRDADGLLLARVPLRAGGDFALRYRNSVYGTVAEERFVVADDGALRLVELAADQLAVLEEYYAVTEPPVRAPPASERAWRAAPARPVVLTELSVAATHLGERTLLVDDRAPLPLWRLVDADPTVVLRVEGAGA
jgi:hypothetical protein